MNKGTAIFLTITLLIIGGYFWYTNIFYKVPNLEILEHHTDAEKAEIIEEWFSKLQKNRQFNGAVLFAKDGKALVQKGYGYTDFNKDDQVNEHSAFRLASLAKQFTAAGIMILKEQGKLDYDDPLSEYFENFPYYHATIRHLLNHTSGIPDLYLDLAAENDKTIDILTNETAVQLVIDHHKKASSVPGEKFNYSNTGYVILGRIIELVSGKTYEEFMKSEIFEPMEMNDSRVWNLLSEERSENQVGGFQGLGRNTKEIKPTFIDGVAGDGAVFSSVNDFLIWDQFWYGNMLLSEENLAQAFKKPILKTGEESDYGFGWVIRDNLTMHTGSWLAAKTFIVRNIDEKSCIVILDNSSNIFMGRIIKQIRKAL